MQLNDEINVSDCIYYSAELRQYSANWRKKICFNAAVYSWNKRSLTVTWYSAEIKQRSFEVKVSIYMI